MIAFLCALPQEAKHLRKLPLVLKGRATLICSGIGPRNAERAVRDLLHRSQPTLVISTGVAGALSHALQPGDIVAATEVIEETTGRRFTCRMLGPSLVRPFSSRIVSVGHMITSAEEKRRLAARFDASAVDMESAAIASVCAERGVPFAAVRAISDTAAETLPEAVARFFDAGGRVRPARVFAALCKKPSLLKVLLRLQRQTATAGEAVERFLSDVSVEPCA